MSNSKENIDTTTKLNAACYAQSHQVWILNTTKPEKISSSLRHETRKTNSLDLMSSRVTQQSCLNVALDGETFSSTNQTSLLFLFHVPEG